MTMKCAYLLVNDPIMIDVTSRHLPAAFSIQGHQLIDDGHELAIHGPFPDGIEDGSRVEAIVYRNYDKDCIVLRWANDEGPVGPEYLLPRMK